MDKERVVKVRCLNSKCAKEYNGYYHKHCPYCTIVEVKINYLGD